eukprot:4106273-Karenia_brevis.AAC.1
MTEHEKDSGDTTSESEGDFPESSDIEDEEAEARVDMISMSGELADFYEDLGILYVNSVSNKVQALRKHLEPMLLCA